MKEFRFLKCDRQRKHQHKMEELKIQRHPSPRIYFTILVSTICPINTSLLIQQSNKLNWKRFIAYNSFMRAETRLRWGEQLIGLWQDLWRNVRREELPSAMRPQRLPQSYTIVLLCNILIKAIHGELSVCIFAYLQLVTQVFADVGREY